MCTSTPSIRHGPGYTSLICLCLLLVYAVLNVSADPEHKCPDGYYCIKRNLGKCGCQLVENAQKMCQKWAINSYPEDCIGEMVEELVDVFDDPKSMTDPQRSRLFRAIRKAKTKAFSKSDISLDILLKSASIQSDFVGQKSSQKSREHSGQKSSQQSLEHSASKDVSLRLEEQSISISDLSLRLLEKVKHISTIQKIHPRTNTFVLNRNYNKSLEKIKLVEKELELIVKRNNRKVTGSSPHFNPAIKTQYYYQEFMDIPACPTISSMIAPSEGRDMHGNTVKIVQPGDGTINGPIHPQIFYTKECDYNTLETSSGCPKCCHGIDRTSFNSKCQTEHSYSPANVRMPLPNGGWSAQIVRGHIWLPCGCSCELSETNPQEEIFPF